MAQGTVMQPGGTGASISMAIKSGESAFSPFERVKEYSDGSATHCGLGDKGIGSVDPAYNPNIDSALPVMLDRQQGTQIGIASKAIAAGSKVYGAASGKLSDVASGAVVGRLTDRSSAAASGDRVEFIPGGDGAMELQTVAAGAALTASSVETSLGAVTIPANRLSAGSRVRLRVQVIATATNSTDTLNVKAYFGSIAAGLLLAATGALDVANNDIAYIEGEVTIRTPTTAVAAGITNIGTPGTATCRAFATASGAVDVTVANDITISGTWSTNNAGNSCRLDVLDVEVLN